MVRFVGSFFGNFPEDDREHVVFAGRSNAGKSSLINMLTGTTISRVSKEPGRTRAVNLFLLEEFNIYLADLPGYGYAKVSKEERERWRGLVENYFVQCKDRIRAVFLLVDILVGPTEPDLLALQWFRTLGLKVVLLLTKVDRANQKETHRALNLARRVFDGDVVLTSSKEGKGKKEVMKYVLGR